MQSLHNILDQMVALKPQTIATDTTTVGETIDLADAGAVEFNLVFGNSTDGDYEVNLFESDDSGMSGEVEITDTTRILGNLLGTAITAVSLASYNWGIVKDLRYVRAKVISTSTSSGSDLSIICSQGKLRGSLETDRNS